MTDSASRDIAEDDTLRLRTIVPPSSVPAPPVIPPWMAHAIGEIGVREAAGAANNPRVQEYHRATKGPIDVADAVAWCASFVNWCLVRCGLVGTQSKAARSFLKHGTQLDKPRLGCIVVTWRKSIFSVYGHAAIWLGEAGKQDWVIGGNQNNHVCPRLQPKAHVLGYFWPAGYPL